MALAWLVLFLVAAAPAGAAAVRLAPASGEPGARATLVAAGLPPETRVDLRVGRGTVNRHFGVLMLRLYADVYSWRFIALNGRQLDFGNGSCG